MSALTAQERAYKMANEKLDGDFMCIPWRYSLRDNPYHRKHPFHAVWHNAFYDECKILNRRLK